MRRRWPSYRPASRSRRIRRNRSITLADVVGLDTLAALWSDADPVSLPGALWSLYLFREWCQGQPDAVCRLWRAGAPRAAVDAVIAGCAADADEQDVRRTVDDILAGICESDAALALDRASRVLSGDRGRASRADGRRHGVLAGYGFPAAQPTTPG